MRYSKFIKAVLPGDTQQNNVIRGVSLIILAAFAISIQDVVFKLFSSELTLWQIFTLRGILAIPLLLTISWVNGIQRKIVVATFQKWPLIRSIFITTTFLAFYAAIPFLSLSTVGAANYIAPIFVFLLSSYFIKNDLISSLGWTGVILGFVGVIILLQPGTDAFSAWAILPVIGAAFYALGHIITRTRCQNVHLAAMTLSLNVVMFLAGVVFSILLVWIQPNEGVFEAYPYIFGLWSSMITTDWLVIALLAGFTIVIGMLLAGAYQVAPPSIVSTFEYSYLIFVAIWDIIFFGIAPTFASFTGMLLIVLAGLLVLYRKSDDA